jgi:(p)ppGpp synthase/HD superfamily hydrolase
MAACYRAQQIAHSVFDIVSGHTKDYLQRLKSNGY